MLMRTEGRAYIEARADTYMLQGLPAKEAVEKAWRDWVESEKRRKAIQQAMESD